MGVKVGVSLWVPQPEHSALRTRTDSASDFGSKLGLSRDKGASSGQTAASPAGTQGQGAGLAAATAHPSHASEALQQELLRRDSHLQGETGGAGVLELYALGLRAGHHLSHVPQAFLASMTSMLPTSPLDAMTGHHPHVRDEDASVVGASRQPAQGSGLVPEPWSLASTEDVAAEPLTRDWAGYLASRWPERRWQVLARPDGLELLVRDYHLTGEEQDALVADLLSRMPASSQPPGRIWLNGRVVWQAESPSTSRVTGGHHGR